MVRFMKDFIKDEDGLSTVEIVIIIAVLVGLALIFRNSIVKFVTDIIGKMFPSDTSTFDNTNKIGG